MFRNVAVPGEMALIRPVLRFSRSIEATILSLVYSQSL